MDVQKGDVLIMKKKHPCGANKMAVLRSGMDFKLRCEGCGRVYDTACKGGKNIRQILRDGIVAF